MACFNHLFRFFAILALSAGFIHPAEAQVQAKEGGSQSWVVAKGPLLGLLFDSDLPNSTRRDPGSYVGRVSPKGSDSFTKASGYVRVNGPNATEGFFVGSLGPIIGASRSVPAYPRTTYDETATQRGVPVIRYESLPSTARAWVTLINQSVKALGAILSRQRDFLDEFPNTERVDAVGNQTTSDNELVLVSGAAIFLLPALQDVGNAHFKAIQAAQNNQPAAVEIFTKETVSAMQDLLFRLFTRFRNFSK